MLHHTWHFVFVALAGLINRHQQDLMAYLQEENRVLREKLGNKRLILNDAQKRRLTLAAMKLGRDLLKNCTPLFSPDTLLRWQCVRKAVRITAEADGFLVGWKSPHPTRHSVGDTLVGRKYDGVYS